MVDITSSIVNTMIFGYLLNFLSQIPWTFIFLFTQSFGIRLYKLTKKEECIKIQKRIGSYSSHLAEDGKASGFSIGYWYILSISVNSSEYNDTYEIWLIATTASYKMLTSDSTDDKEFTMSDYPNRELPEDMAFPVVVRSGCFTNIYYRKRQLKLPIVPRMGQTKIIKGLLTKYKEKSSLIVLLHGNPGTGKSMIGVLLAKELKGMYCNTFKPWQAGDSFSNLYMESDPTQEKPLIIAMDEIDMALVNIHAGIPQPSKICISVSDKSGWNLLLDEIQRGLYPYVILFMTTNKTPEFIRNLDPSYIRDGRVDAIIKV